jgi:hypothetical protein
MDYVWVEKDQDIRKIVNTEMKVHIKWTKKPKEDYLELSRRYMNAGYITLKEVIENPHHNNIKYDMWFLPGVYMIRQAIELLVKAGLAIKGSTKPELQEIFLANKHNVKALYSTYKNSYGAEALEVDEKIWLESYLNAVEVIDSGSDLFRYPFKDQFMEQYGDEALDVHHMGNRLIYCYSTLNKMIFGEWFEEDELDLEEKPEFIELANSGMYNCYLWNSPFDSGFHKQVTGYSEVGMFLFDKFKETKDVGLFYPIVFLMRNAIEIALKRLLHMKMEESVDEKIIRGKRNSHKLYTDLWKSIKPMLLHYSGEDNQDDSTLELVESYIIELDKLDKQGDVFRYPSSFSHEYKFNNEKIDVENFVIYLLALFHSIDNFDSRLDHIRDIEMEMRSEWEAEMEEEMRSNMDYYDYQ